MDVSVIAAMAMLLVGILAGLWAGLSRRRRCTRCGEVLPTICGYGCGCMREVRPWIASYGEEHARQARGERP